MFQFKRTVISFLCTMPVLLCAKVRADDSVLAGYLSKHAAARDSIHSCMCRVEHIVEYVERSDFNFRRTASYRRLAGKVRMTVNEPSSRKELLYSDGITRTLTTLSSTQEKHRVGGAIGHSTPYPRMICDPWTSGLLLIPVPGLLTYAPLEQVVRDAKRVDCREPNGNSEVVVIQIDYEEREKPFGKWHVEVFLDPAANYLIRRATTSTTLRSTGHSILNHYGVDRFVEAVPGVFFPEIAHFRGHVDGKHNYSEICQVKELRVNSGVGASSVALNFPPGVTIVDGIEGTTYQVDSQGRRVGPAQPRGKAVLPPALPTGSPNAALANDPADSLTETRTDQTSLTKWILPASCGLLIAVLGFRMLQMRRQ